MENNETLKILTEEEVTAVQKLTDIHNTIADARLELDKVLKATETAYNDRSEQERLALDDLYARSKELVAEVYKNYDEIVAMYAQASDMLRTIKELSDKVERASLLFNSKHDKFIDFHDQKMIEYASIKKKIEADHIKIAQERVGLDAFHKKLLNIAAQVDSREQSLKAIKK